MEYIGLLARASAIVAPSNHDNKEKDGAVTVSDRTKLHGVFNPAILFSLLTTA